MRRPAPLVAALEPAEPRTSLLIGEVTASRLRPWSTKAWTWHDEGGRLAAAVVLDHQCFDRWGAKVYLADENAAASVAAHIDRGPAWTINGAAPDVAPLLDHLGRRSQLLATPWIVSSYPHQVVGKPDNRTRVAIPDDVDGLVELFSSFEFRPASTWWQARSWARRLVKRSMVIVADDTDHALADGTRPLAGAIVVTFASHRYASVDTLTVLPAYRQRGLGWSLAARAQAVLNALGIDGFAAIAPTNPMEFGDVYDDNWLTAILRPPRRFRGQNRLRAWYGRIGAIPDRPLTLFRDPADPNRPPAA